MKGNEKRHKKVWNKVDWFLTKCLKSNFYERAICISVVLSVILLMIYAFSVGGNVSTSNADWGNFGSFFGSITGLLAFAGAFYAIDQSNKRMKEAEERTCYNRFMETYYDIISSIRYKDKVGNEAIIDYSIDLVFYDFIYMLSHHDNKVFRDLKENKILSEDVSKLELLIYSYLSTIYPNLFSTSSPVFDEVSDSIIEKKNIIFLIKTYVLRDRKTMPLFSYYEAVISTYSIIDNTLDRYFQFMFSTLDYIETQMPNYYLKLFCSQITSKEALILFHRSLVLTSKIYSFSSFYNSDIWSSIDIDDIPVKKNLIAPITPSERIQQQKDVCDYINDIYGFHKPIL